MDFAQTFDVVHTPPSFEDFSRDKVERYRDIGTGRFKLLQTFDQGLNKFGGPSVVLKLQRDNGEIRQAWAPSSLVFALRRRAKTDYIWNHGLKESEKTGDYFYDFGFF